jgi:polar amino acid transport system substrate-binding protein
MKSGSVVFTLFSLMLMLISQAYAKKHQITFAVNSPGSAPYIYYDNMSGKYKGVVVDFFTGLEENSSFKIEYLDSNRARSEELLLRGLADIFLSSVVWLEQPNNYIFSNTLMHHNSYMYSTFAFSQAFNPSQFKRAFICTRHNYTYPVLDHYFDNNKLMRIDSSSQTTMAIMLAKGRCDFAIMSNDNARAVLSNSEFCAIKFHQSPNVISVVDVAFVIRSELSDVKKQIDELLTIFISSGERDKSIQRHSGNQVFPKLLCSN